MEQAAEFSLFSFAETMEQQQIPTLASVGSQTQQPAFTFDVAPKPRIDDKLAAATNAMEALLRGGAALDRKILTDVMVQAYGAHESSGAWSPRDAYDAAEVAAIEIVREWTNTDDPVSDLARFTALNALMPLQSRRNEETVAFDQFSTPLDAAFLAAHAAALTDRDIVLEPSAGTGMLAVHALRAGAKLIVNEYERHRAHLLKRLDVAPLSLDARYLGALYGANERPSVVLMNPPFSATVQAGRVAGTAIRHIEQALVVLRPGGRLVAIIGANDDPGVSREKFQAVFEKATLLASVALLGNVFHRSGTDFATRLLVLEKGHDPDVEPILGERHYSVEEALGLLQLPPRAIVTKVEGRGVVIPLRRREAVKRASTATISGASTTFAGEAPAPVTYDTLTDAVVSIDDDVFESYRPQTVRFHNACVHPNDLIESAAMASVRMPVPTYVPLLEPSIVAQGIISEAQLEAVLYAGDAHQTTFKMLVPRKEVKSETNGTPIVTDAFVMTARRGFAIGDGGGVGKGRITATIIRDNFNHGRTTAAWVSENTTLIEDARRDWVALGGRADEVIDLSRTPCDDRLPARSGILFIPYGTLRSGSRRNPERTRIAQIVEFLQPDPDVPFEGVLAFDEAHNMGNAAPAKGDRGNVGASQVGLAGLEIQQQLPMARVVYLSATGQSKIDAFAYAVRLGLWGPDTAFESRERFIAQLGNGGTAAFEAIARDLKALGLYMARSLSLRGVTYERIVHELTDEQYSIYAAANQAWRLVERNLEAALLKTEATRVNASGHISSQNGRAVGAAKSAFQSTKQRFYESLLIAMKSQTALEYAKGELRKGHSVVVQLTNTNEAVMERALAGAAEDLDLEDLEISPKDQLLDYIRRAFPTLQYETYMDDNGDMRSRPLIVNDEPVHSPEALEMRERLLEELASINIPDDGLSTFIDGIGVENVAEVTGRKRRVVRRMIDGELRRIVEDRSSKANTAETDAFMNGTKRVLIFSHAGGTGRSYHASLACKNQQPRIHLLLQAGWQSAKALQGLFRTHRTAQAHAPHYGLITTNVPAEKRFIATIAKRLDDLGALTRGQREAAGGGVFTASDALEGTYANAALRNLLQSIAGNTFPALSYTNFKEQTGLVLTNEDGQDVSDGISLSRFLNRLLACDIDADGGTQRLLMDELESRVEAQIRRAIDEGSYDHGIETIRPIRIGLLEEHDLYTEARTQAKTILRVYEVENHPTFMTFAKIEAKVRHHRLTRGQKTAGFFRCVDDDTVHAIFPSRDWSDANEAPHVWDITPTSDSRRLAESKHTFMPVDDADARALWETEIAAAATIVSKLHLVSGTLLPVWDRLPQKRTRVYRLRDHEGKATIGRVIYEHEIPAVMRAFGRDDLAIITTESAVSMAQAGRIIQIGQQLRVKRSLVNGVRRLELIHPNPIAVQPVWSELGIIFEKIAYRLRAFIPTGREAELIGRIAGDLPISMVGDLDDLATAA